MKSSPFLALSIAYGFLVTGFLLPIVLPETLKKTSEQILSIEPSDEGGLLSSPQNHSFKKKISLAISNIRELMFVFQNPTLAALSITFLILSLYSRNSDLVFLLASDRFHWSISEASFLIPIGAIIRFGTLVVLLPLLYHLLSSRSSMSKDLFVVRASLIFLILGSLVIAIAPVPALYILGILIYGLSAGFSPAVRSLATSLVHPDHVSRLYAIIATGDTVGIIVFSPLVGKSYGWGVGLGGWWSGMAFICCAGLYAVFGASLWVVREPREEDDVHGD